MNDTPLFSLYEIAYVYCSSRRIGHLSACFPCHGKTRVNGGRQKAKTAGVLMNLSRLRQLGPQQFTKKDRRRLARQAFFNYLRSSRYYFFDFDILARSVYQLLTFFLLASTVVSKQQSENPCF